MIMIIIIIENHHFILSLSSIMATDITTSFPILYTGTLIPKIRNSVFSSLVFQTTRIWRAGYK